ncbi:MAG: hypothetical protein ABI868_16225 [Acidobacteriota bacterium]
MSIVQVVEIRTLTDEAVEEPVARFVLLPDGSARLVELRPDGQDMVEELLRGGVPGTDGKVLFPQNGMAYMQRLPYLLHATYLWATEVYEMDDAEALAGTAPD